MSVERKRRGRGRPRDPAKLEAILDAAYDLFLDRGIAATPMDLVAERAGVSKMTVYANFRDKPALLAAVFDRMRKTIRLPDLPVESNLNLSLERLAEFGELTVSVLTRPEVVRETRVMAECAADQSRLANVFYTAGRGELLKQVAGFLKGLTERGVLAIDDPELAAEQLIGAWLGMAELRQSLGVAGPPSSNAIAKRVRYAIDTLVRAWSTGVEPGSADKTYKRARSGRRAGST
ncbi:TetR/AcrR family transcriptional regulator [Bradyrhizobium genosp. A]|uniref:TetR/AcrR family transcriptional regulator n=1 Tax=Bradyrhizobium genosp. A TaxID=83626 RepID=UPI003CF447DC